MNQILHKTEVVGHCAIATAIQVAPGEKVRAVRLHVPGVLFKELLTHKELGDARRCKQDRIGEAGAAAGIPAMRFVAVRQSWNAWVSSRQHQIVVLYAGNRPPCMVETRRIQSVSYPGKGDGSAGPAGCRPDGVPECSAQVVVLNDVEACAACRGGSDDWLS